MSAEYAPGTVAVATVKGERNVRVTRGEGIFASNWYTNRPVCGSNTAFPDSVVTDVRPLVVLDLADPQALVADLNSAAYCDRDHGRMSRIDMLAQTIEAQTKPPQPSEPTGRGAVVVDVAGLEWVRIHPGGKAWVNCYQRFERYDDIDAVRVLSEGVTQ